MVATLLVAVMACLPLLGSNVAMLIPVTGGVQVNGQPLAAAGTAIGAGDRVAIDERGTARMVIPGGTVIAAAKTNFRLENNQAIRLSYGMVKVAGQVPVLLNTRTVVPLTSGARYVVTALNGPVYVQAVAGKVQIRLGSAAYTVDAGNAATFQDTTAGQTQTQSTTTTTTTPDQNQPAQTQTTTPDQNQPAAGTTQTQSTTTTEQQGAQTTTTTTTTPTQTTTTQTTATQTPAPTGSVSPTVAVPVAIAIMAAAAAVTGIVTYEVTKCSGCVPSPSQ
jgi:hypothetical protein